MRFNIPWALGNGNDLLTNFLPFNFDNKGFQGKERRISMLSWNKIKMFMFFNQKGQNRSIFVEIRGPNSSQLATLWNVKRGLKVLYIKRYFKSPLFLTHLTKLPHLWIG